MVAIKIVMSGTIFVYLKATLHFTLMENRNFLAFIDELPINVTH